MIARCWHGRTGTEDADTYARYVEATGIAAHRRTPGNLASMLLRRDDQNCTHFVVISLWESMDAIRSFAGESPEVAVYFPEDEKYLLEMEPGVTHYEVPVYEQGAPR
jgi:heme-degrading monooxygenase HmoA